MQLPDSLQPWREWLEWFTPDVWPGFSDILGRLNPLLGPLRGVQSGGTPDMEGLADLQNRGPYERLLTSEWLLADELPDEFLRRASTGEHLFLAPEQRARKANRKIVVLFDAGPLQWGAPRLVHLALMILLARRAQVAGGELQWGILQKPEHLLTSLNSANSLKHMLQARTESPASPAHWQHWRDWLDEQAEPAGEYWVVGAGYGRDTVPPVFTHRVQLQRTMDGQGIRFDLDNGRRQRVTLAMPNQTAGQRLLKGQFETHTPSRAPDNGLRVALTYPPVISFSGSHVALMLLDEPGSVVFRVPSVGQKKPQIGRRQLWMSGLKPVAASFVGNSFAAVLSNAAYLHFWKMGPFQSISSPSRETFLIPDGTASLLSSVWLGGTPNRLYCLDRQGKLICWGHNNKRETELTHLEKNVIGLARIGQESLAYLKNEAGRLFLTTLNSRDIKKESYLLGPATDVTQVLFAGSPGRRNAFSPCAVYHLTKGVGTWHVHSCATDPLKAQAVSLNASHQPVGLLCDARNEQWSLVLVNAGKTSVSLYKDQQIETLFTTSSPIVRQTFCPVSGLFAALTEARELLVFSVREKAMRLRVLCNGVTDQKTAP